ncbi:hypothetical protein ES703_47085 [subsurface metagenome]
MIDSLINGVSWLIDLLIYWVPKILLYSVAFTLMGMFFNVIFTGHFLPHRYKPKKRTYKHGQQRHR